MEDLTGSAPEEEQTMNEPARKLEPDAANPGVRYFALREIEAEIDPVLAQSVTENLGRFNTEVVPKLQELGIAEGVQ